MVELKILFIMRLERKGKYHIAAYCHKLGEENFLANELTDSSEGW